MVHENWLTRRTALRTGVTATGLLGLGTRTATARAGVPPPDDLGSDGHRYYQVDFVAGEPIETLGETPDAFYGRQNRLIQYVHTDSERSGDEVVERDTWLASLDSDTHGCISRAPNTWITAEQMSGGVAVVEFAVASGCEVTLSLAVYRSPAGSSPSTPNRNSSLPGRTRSARDITSSQ